MKISRKKSSNVHSDGRKTKTTIIAEEDPLRVIPMKTTLPPPSTVSTSDSVTSFSNTSSASTAENDMERSEGTMGNDRMDEDDIGCRPGSSDIGIEPITDVNGADLNTEGATDSDNVNSGHPVNATESSHSEDAKATQTERPKITIPPKKARTAAKRTTGRCVVSFPFTEYY